MSFRENKKIVIKKPEVSTFLIDPAKTVCVRVRSFFVEYFTTKKLINLMSFYVFSAFRSFVPPLVSSSKKQSTAGTRGAFQTETENFICFLLASLPASEGEVGTKCFISVFIFC